MTDLGALYLLLLVGSVRSSTPDPQNPVCVDQLTDCESYGASACQGVYKEWASENCASYCGFCGFAEIPTTHHPIPPKGSCHDTLTTCTDYGHGVCEQYSVWARQNCASYCGFCGDIATTPPSSGSSGCSFNGHVYGHGEMWQEGCTYHCQCVDGSTGQYKCTEI